MKKILEIKCLNQSKEEKKCSSLTLLTSLLSIRCLVGELEKSPGQVSILCRISAPLIYCTGQNLWEKKDDEGCIIVLYCQIPHKTKSSSCKLNYKNQEISVNM